MLTPTTSNFTRARSRSRGGVWTIDALRWSCRSCHWENVPPDLDQAELQSCLASTKRPPPVQKYAHVPTSTFRRPQSAFHSRAPKSIPETIGLIRSCCVVCQRSLLQCKRPFPAHLKRQFILWPRSTRVPYPVICLCVCVTCRPESSVIRPLFDTNLQLPSTFKPHC